MGDALLYDTKQAVGVTSVTVMVKKICIIGAGASGLTAIKCCLDEELVPVCYEQSQHIGGTVWTRKICDQAF